jgi:hypothetical protein
MVVRPILQEIAEAISADQLVGAWNIFAGRRLKTFSRTKFLYDYQQKAVENALKVLYLYFEEFGGRDRPDEAKETLYRRYLDNGFEEPRRETRNNDPISKLRNEYFGEYSFKSIINRMSFWMATGSGKTLVLVKLIEALRLLMETGAIPKRQVLILTSRDDLLEQIKNHVKEFNQGNDFGIDLRDLRTYDEAIRNAEGFFGEKLMPVFYYRGDLIRDTAGENILDFRSFDNNGQWYILLDEAHKGYKELSKRHVLFSILARNGFLFSFSATFTDWEDICSTVYNLNLERFINTGYGKHILLSSEELRAFADREEFDDGTKQKIVLKTLILLAHIRKARLAIPGFYHDPLLVALCNTVTTEDADLWRLFCELAKIGMGKVDETLFTQARDELQQSLRGEKPFFDERLSVNLRLDEISSISLQDILQMVYNADRPGAIEAWLIPENRQEFLLKLRTSDRHFGLVVIGDISANMKKLEEGGYMIETRHEKESIFRRINEPRWKDITILMGSRKFYEGWDSNRPNIITYINIGVGEDARKFVLQSLGRGVRIQPFGEKRKRALPLYNEGEMNNEDFEAIRGHKDILETLFVFGTKKSAIETIFESLDKVRTSFDELSLERNPEADRRELLIPVYRTLPMNFESRASKFSVSKTDFERLKSLYKYLEDDRVRAFYLDLDTTDLEILSSVIKDEEIPSRFNLVSGGASGVPARILVQKAVAHFKAEPKDFERFKKLGDEIVHFRRIKVSTEKYQALQEKIEKMKVDPQARIKCLKEKLGNKEITLDEYTEKVRNIPEEETLDAIKIKYIAEHYYIPVLLSEQERVDYIQHIIKVPSEVRFVNELIKERENLNKAFDWWMFSKIDESLDKDIYIPYYNPGRIAFVHYYPDFILWLQKGNDYFIVFVDPKGTGRTEYELKVDGYTQIFEENGAPKKFEKDGMVIRVLLFMGADDESQIGQRYKRYWFDNIQNMISRINTSQIC